MRCASTWTLLAVAVRVASAQGLGSEDVNNWSAFDLEMRRRLWFSIGVLDTQTALDRGSLPLLPFRDFKFPPLNIDDSEMSPTATPTPSLQKFTDMSFSCMTHEAMVCQKKISKISAAPDEPLGDWDEKLCIVVVFGESMSRQYLEVNHPEKPLEMFTKMVAGDIVVTMQLLLQRPLHRTKHNNVSQWDGADVMKVATEVLERFSRKRTSSIFAPWIWFSWVKWYALAIVLAELCSGHKGPLAEKAYLIAQDSFAQYAQLVADTDTGMLWKPIAKLMRRVQRLRDDVVQDKTVMASSCSSAVQTDSQQSVLRESGQETFQHFGCTSGHGSQDLESSLHLNATDVDWIMWDKANKACIDGKDDLQDTINEGFDLEERNSWLNWDLFLEDVNTSTDVT